jgi:hypothetical protein
MKNLLIMLSVFIAFANNSLAQIKSVNSTDKKVNSMNYEAGFGLSFKDSFIRGKFGTNNIYKKFGTYLVVESKSSTKYSNVIIGGNYFLNENWGAFAGIGVSNGRKEIGISYRTEKFGGLDLGYSSTVGPTLTYLYSFGKKK